MREEWKSFWEASISALYPSRMKCIVCGEELNKEVELELCERCTLPFNDGKVCLHCGRAIENESDYCENCRNHVSYFDGAYSPLRFEHEARRLIHDLKFGYKKYLARPLGTLIRDTAIQSALRPDVVIPVPLSTIKLKERGFNQAEELAKCVAAYCRLVPLNALYKKKDNPDQARQDRKTRIENAKDLFACVDNVDLKHKNILLVDDVMTSGATIESCCRILRQKHPSRIDVITLASVPQSNRSIF